MAEHQTHKVAVTLDTPPIAPLFIPLLEVAEGTTLLASQCALTVSGTPSPLEVAVMLCKPDTALGDPGDAVLYVSDVVSVVADEPFVLPGSIPALGQSGVLGLHVPVQTLTLPMCKRRGFQTVPRSTSRGLVQARSEIALLPHSEPNL